MKKLGIILYFLVCSCGAFAQPHANLTRDLIAHYPFTLNAGDSSIYKQHGTVSGAKLTESARCGASAYYFDGKDDYIDFGNPKIFERGLREMTISVWVMNQKTDFKQDAFGMIIGKWAFDPAKDQFGLFINSNNKIVMSIGDGKKHGEGIYANKKIQNNVWYHIVAVFRAPDKIRLYINGKLDREGTQEGTTGMLPKSDVSLKVGRQMLNHNRAYEGLLSGIRMYKRALSDDEIKQLFDYEGSICKKFILEGDVLDANKMQPIGMPSEVIIKNLKTGEDVLSTDSDPVDGYYKIELPIGQQYGIFAKAENYRYVSVNQSIDTRADFEKKNKTAVKAGVTQEIVMRRDLLMIPFEVGQKVRVNNVFFDFGKADLQDESFSELDFLVGLFTAFPNLVLEIGGHTDNVGSDDANQKLSAARANSVRTYLMGKGIGAEKVIAKGYGEAMPVADNESEEGKQLNRRVEFTIVQK